MTAKGIATGNGPADRLLEQFRDDLTAPVNATSKQEIAGAWLQLKRAVRAAIPKILAAERARTLASLRGRVDRLDEFMPHCVSRRDVLDLLDEMEQEATLS